MEKVVVERTDDNVKTMDKSHAIIEKTTEKVVVDRMDDKVKTMDKSIEKTTEVEGSGMDETTRQETTISVEEGSGVEEVRPAEPPAVRDPEEAGHEDAAAGIEQDWILMGNLTSKKGNDSDDQVEICEEVEPKEEKIGQFLRNLRQFLTRASTVQLRQFLDDRHTNRSLTERLAEAVQQLAKPSLSPLPKRETKTKHLQLEMEKALVEEMNKKTQISTEPKKDDLLLNVVEKKTGTR